eukprot:gene8222-5246_t
MVRARRGARTSSHSIRAYQLTFHQRSGNGEVVQGPLERVDASHADTVTVEAADGDRSSPLADAEWRVQLVHGVLWLRRFGGSLLSVFCETKSGE